MMKTPQTRLLVAALALSFPILSMAQGVVPPPTPPGALAEAPKVAPPMAVTSANPAAAVSASPVAPPPALIDIAIPDAPKSAPAADLKPSAASAGKSAKKPAVREATAKPEEKPAKPVDPFAGMAVTPVSDSGLNRFVFPEAVEGVFFPEGAPLPECGEKAGPMDPCKPVFLNGKRVMLLQLRAGAKGPIQMLTHLASGRFIETYLMPAAGPASIVRIDGAEDGASDSRLVAAAKAQQAQPERDSMSASEQYVALLTRFASGDIPAGFEAIKAGQRVRFEHFDVIPMTTWDNGNNLRAHFFQVQAHTDAPVVINASLFRRTNVRALALDRETITKSAPAQLYMLEYVPTEGQ